MMEWPDRAVYLVGGLLSAIGALIVAGCSCRLSRLKKHPSSIVVFISIADCCLGLHFLFNAIFPPSVEDSKTARCMIDSSFAQFSKVATLNWNFILCLDTLLVLSRPLSICNQRQFWYHIFAWGTAVLSMIPILALNDSEVSEFSTCYISSQSVPAVWLIIPELLYLPFAIVSAFLVARQLSNGLPLHKKQRQDFLTRHCIAIIIFCVVWFFPVFYSTLVTVAQVDLPVVMQDVFRRIMGACTATQGFWLAIARFSEPVLFSNLRKRTLVPSSPSNLLETDSSTMNQPFLIVDSTASSSFASVDRHRENRFLSTGSDPRDRRGSSFADDLSYAQAVKASRTYEAIYSILSSICHVFNDPFHKIPLTVDLSVDAFEESCYSEVSTRRVTVTLPGATSAGGMLKRTDKKSVLFSEFAPNVFKHIRAIESMQSIDILKSLDPNENADKIASAGQSKGRGGSIMFFSYDHRFIIKTLTTKEKDVLLDVLLQPLHSHIMQYPDTLLAKIYGCFSIDMSHSGLSTVHCLLMENIFASVPRHNHMLDQVYDLKGSRADRRSMNRPASSNSISSSVSTVSVHVHDTERPILKDLDFEERIESLHLDSVVSSRLINQLEADTHMLSELNIMDYSLLIGVAKPLDTIFLSSSTSSSSFRAQSILRRTGSLAANACLSGPLIVPESGTIYYLGLIDFLQLYDSSKVLEHQFKKLRLMGPDMSAVSASKYQNRFMNFLRRICNSAFDSTMLPVQDLHIPGGSDLCRIDSQIVESTNIQDEDDSHETDGGL